MPGLFDPDTFLHQPVKGANDTKRVLCPIGVWPAHVEDVETVVGEKEGRAWYKMNVLWNVQSPEVLAETNRDKVIVRQGFFLDITEDGALDMGKGKNVPLGKLREATHTNDADRDWMPSHLIGQSALVNVDHEQGKEPGDMRDYVRSVAALA